MNKLKTLFILFLSCVLLFSCSKDDNINPQNGSHSYGLSGTIYFDWASDGVLKIDLSTGKKSNILPENVERYSWDITQDKKVLLTSTDDADNIDANIFTFTNLKTGEIISQFKYYPYGSMEMAKGYLSPNKQLIALEPDFDYGIVILDRQGNELHNLRRIGNEEIGYGSKIDWMTDNTLVFTTDEGIYRTNSSFSRASLILKPHFQVWGNVAVSPDGEKIAFRGGNHIWMMNSDGSSLRQITTSGEIETCCCFSPDSKYLLIGTNYNDALNFGEFWDLTIIPADGKKYNVDFNNNPDDEVIFLKEDGNWRDHQAGDGYAVWR